MPPTEPAEHALQRHLYDVHRNGAALSVSLEDAAASHYAEHHGPGGLRNHDDPPELHDWDALVERGLVGDTRVAELERRIARMEDEHARSVEYFYRLSHLYAAVGQVFEAAQLLHAEMMKRRDDLK